MGPPRVIGGYGELARHVRGGPFASMGPPRVIGGYGFPPSYKIEPLFASMGPPRVIGGYARRAASRAAPSGRFNGAAESNRRILGFAEPGDPHEPVASMGPPRVIGGYADRVVRR